MTGNFNIHVDDASDNFAAELRELFDTLKLQEHVKESTQTLGRTLDLFLRDDGIDVCALTVTDVAGSDRYLLTCSVDVSAAPATFVTRTS